MRPMRLAAALCAVLLMAPACGDDDGGISVERPWARESAGMANAGAAYMQITSADGDTLIGASVDSSIAGVVEIHEVVEVDMSEGTSDDGMGDDMSGMEEGMGGAMRMQPVESIALPAGETVSLQPGGYHVMMMQLVAPFEIGQKFTVTLQFEKADDLDVEVEVREEAP